MKTMSDSYFSANSAKVRRVKAKALRYKYVNTSIYKGYALSGDYSQNTFIKSLEIQRVGEDSKFFGFGVTHKMNIKIIDVDSTKDIAAGDYFNISLGLELTDGTVEYVDYPKVWVTEVHRDENTGLLSVTAYDKLSTAASHTVSEMDLSTPYTLRQFANIAASIVDGEDRSEKNLIKLTQTEATRYTVDEDGYFLVNATFEYPDVYGSPMLYVTIDEEVVLEPGTYTTKINLISGSPNGSFDLAVLNSDSVALGNVSLGGNPVSFTVEEETTITAVILTIHQDTSFDNVKAEFVLQRSHYIDNVFDDPTIPVLGLEYATGANFDGTETIQDALTAVAEATQTIYYMGADNKVHFKRLDVSGDPVKTISKSDYITLESGANRRLQTICHATELGDNVSASTSLIGTTQYVRDNPFWDLRDDIDTLVEDAVAAMGDMTINQFDCSWRGDISLEIGDKIAFVAKDDTTATSYLLNDTITYDGGLSQKTEWNYADTEETDSNPSNLGEALKQTYAKVDKVNRQIDLLVTEVGTNSEAISAMQLNSESITASVTKIETNVNETLESVHNDMNTLTQKVEAAITAENLTIEVQKELANGVSSVKTTTGFTFDDEGLTVSKSGSEMTTQITEDGMTVYRDDEAMLTANNEGVNAVNLHATTYLIIGTNSRFEDWEKDGESRTACFWIGGSN